MRSIGELSLGWQTELIFPRFDGEVTLRDDHAVVRTPANPTFHWGNFLLFDRPPKAGDAARWLAAFDAEITRRQPASNHIAIGVDSPVSFELPADFHAAGIALERATTLTLTRSQLQPPLRMLPGGFEVSTLQLPGDIAAAVELQVAADEGEYEPSAYRLFRERQMARYRALQDAGCGHWFGIRAQAPSGPQLVADCGLFRDPFRAAALGRFQNVCTHPGWRRRGLCRALIHAVARHGFDAMGLETLVIVADPGDVAIGIYASVGFAPHDETRRLYRRPPP